MRETSLRSMSTCPRGQPDRHSSILAGTIREKLAEEIVMSHIASPTVYVTYEGAPADRFDRSYYVEHHLPLVMRAWQQYGLESVAAFFPPLTHVGTLVICECRFRDEAAIDTAFGSQEAAAVMADVPRFTDLAPTRLRITLL
ncbi:EthD family reductase [Paraburkholderia fungorum]|nr:EthD family reductase [Paraburkholderia fungorum]